MDNANAKLCKRLHDVLDVIGASEYIRGKYREFAMIHEITHTCVSLIYSKPSNHISYYLVGSRCEGATTDDLDSDLDLIYCYDGIPVAENVFESKQQGRSCLMLTDEDTHPGYVRLKIVEDKYPLTIGMCVTSNHFCFIDEKGRVCANNVHFELGIKSVRNGPAYMTPANNIHCQIDEVYASRCRHIPESANSWLYRIRKYDWPSQKQLTAMGSYGCFFVGVGHPHSEDKYSEWRISFSLQERDLMSSLNKTQHKCYILLKMIKKDIIEPKAGESISSYHCKTSLFYTMENSQRHFWTDDKLIMCVQQCLKRLFIWVKAKNCPNYFIPEANLFDKLSGMILEKVEHVLNDILKSDMKFLYSLTCDNVGELLKSKLCGDELVSSLANTSSMIQPIMPESIYDIRNILMGLMPMPTNTYTAYMNGLMPLLIYLKHTNHVTEHTTRDVRMALDSIIPHIKLQYEQCLFAQYVSGGDLSCMWSDKFQNVILGTSSDIDLFSSKLSLASLYIQFGQYQEECKHILVSCEKEIEPFVISVCGCYSKSNYINTAIAKKMRCTDMSSKELRLRCTTGCMVFHPSQVRLVHEALQYEIFRNVFTQPETGYYKQQDYWFSWITVDSKIYLYFLQYLFFSKTENGAETCTAVRKLFQVVNTDDNIGHEDTALNLLGWIYLQDNDLQTAWKFFRHSWKMRPFKNAAKWHILILLSEKLKEKYPKNPECMDGNRCLPVISYVGSNQAYFR